MLEEFLGALAARRPSLIDLGLDRVRATLSRLGDPHHRLPPTIHVAGTNGKGSTVAFLRAILQATGARTHVFVSPHLVRYNERIILAGNEISDEALIDVLRRVDEVVADDALTFFETIACAAFLAYAETPADYLILEVGLGGRLDATNVIDAPLAAAVTPVALDHQQFLGRTHAEIAREKAGIFKPGCPAVIGVQEPDAMAALIDQAQRVGADVFAYGENWTFWEEHGRLTYQDDNGLCDLSPPRLFGRHQFANAALAVATVRAAGIEIDDAALSAGLEQAVWPARFERLKAGAAASLLDPDQDGSEVWLDGGHNPHAAIALAAGLGELEERSSKPLIIIAGMQANKDPRGFLAPFAGLARRVIATSSGHPLALAPAEIVAAARDVGLNASAAPNLEASFAAARACVDGPARFLIAGSLYLAGDVLKDDA